MPWLVFVSPNLNINQTRKSQPIDMAAGEKDLLKNNSYCGWRVPSILLLTHVCYGGPPMNNITILGLFFIHRENESRSLKFG